MNKLKIGLSGVAGLGALYALFGVNRTTPSDMSDIKSSMIHAAGYNKEKKQLSVKFNDGNVYVFSNVPDRVYTKLKNSDSAGGYFNKSIRNKYTHEKVSSMQHQTQNPFDRIKPPATTKSLSDVLVDLRKLDTPDKWRAYVNQKNYTKSQKDVSHHVGS